MLALWRPPQAAGDPVGCLATTFTFSPGLFDEQCLARFLEIESEPNRENLAFLLERESRLGGIYAGALVDYTQAGVEHSLRWDVLPVRVSGGKQHAKLSLLAWTHHIRIIVASANLTEQGCRSNFEIASSVDLGPEDADVDSLNDAVAFLRSLLLLVPASSDQPPEIRRAEAFLRQVERQAKGWKQPRRREAIRQYIVCTLASIGMDRPARSSMEEAIQLCRARGGSPSEARIASPFFDVNDDTGRVTTSLCKLMARGVKRELTFCVPVIQGEDVGALPRLAAPKALLLAPRAYQGSVTVEMLPRQDKDKNPRPWHAKMMALLSGKYSALMIGSSNFTCAGMGVGQHRNAEANLLTVADYVAYGREFGQLKEVWPEMDEVADPESLEWLGANPDQEEEEQNANPLLPAGFLSVTYRAGEKRQILLRLDPAKLPEDWHVHACGREGQELLSAAIWEKNGCSTVVELSWGPAQPPEKLLVRWLENEAFLPLNVEDSRDLPPPTKIERMSADDMLWILASADPGAAFRVWAGQQQPSDFFDPALDAAEPVDLDPLRRYDLNATFLHRVRRRARIFSKLRLNLQRPVWGQQALEWRLRGLIGIEPLADRLMAEFENAGLAANEALLTLADFLILLREVDYQPTDGSLSKTDFNRIFLPFLREMADKLTRQIDAHGDGMPDDLMDFWKRVVRRCQE